MKAVSPSRGSAVPWGAPTPEVDNRDADFPLLISLQTPDHQTRAMYELPTIRSR
jgi:hypothetical protein